MAIRVMLIGLGPIGAAVARQVAVRKGFTLVAGTDIDPAKIGRDLGDVIALGKKTRVRVTDQRVILKTGLFTLRTENFELYRVNDITVVEPFGERLLGFGRVVLLSSDRTDGHLELRGLRNVEQLADQIRHAVEVQKQARRVATLAEA